MGMRSPKTLKERKNEMNESGNDGADCPQETLAKRFEALLRQTGRKGIENVLAELRALGFFSAPASARFHGNYPGGLLKHSLNVYDEAMLVRDAQLGLMPDIAARLPSDSIAIVALLHDICKAEVYKEMEKFRKDKDGQWEKYSAYGVDYTGLEMTDDEIIAIRWHMSGFDLAFQSPEIRNNYNEASGKCPLLAVLKAADGLASHVLGT